MTRDLVKSRVLHQNIETRWPHFKKKVLEAYYFLECARKNNARKMDFENTKFWPLLNLKTVTMLHTETSSRQPSDRPSFVHITATEPAIEHSI